MRAVLFERADGENQQGIFGARVGLGAGDFLEEQAWRNDFDFPVRAGRVSDGDSLIDRRLRVRL